ncbi:MAG: MFS transporter [Pseudomonadota bacterium]
MSEVRSDAPFWCHSNWRAVVAAFAFNGFLFGVWASRVPAFKETLNLDPGTLGLLLLALAGGAIISFPAAGSLSQRLGAERLTIWCGWAYSPALVALGLATNPLWLGLGLFVFGAVHGAMDVAMNGWGAEVETKLGKSTMSVFHAMFSMGAGIGAASGFLAVQMGFEPVHHFGIVGLLGAAIAIPVMLAGQSAPLPVKAKANASSLFSLPSRSLVFVGLIAFTVAMGEGAMADWSGVFLRVVAEATQSQAALGYTVFSIPMVLN